MEKWVDLSPKGAFCNLSSPSGSGSQYPKVDLRVGLQGLRGGATGGCSGRS